MDQKEKYKHWEEIAQYDLETAKVMFRSGRYLYVAFMCQQSLEKLVKGLHVLHKAKEASRTHNIHDVFREVFDSQHPKFMQKEQMYKPFFVELVSYYVADRYPSYKTKIAATIDEHKAQKILRKTEEVFIWLQSLVKL
jgi:HEPN domain-containing protein